MKNEKQLIPHCLLYFLKYNRQLNDVKLFCSYHTGNMYRRYLFSLTKVLTDDIIYSRGYSIRQQLKVNRKIVCKCNIKLICNFKMHTV